MPKNQPNAWYALRRTLPVWSFDQNLRELITVLPRYGVDEVIIKVDTEEFTHGQPPLEWVRDYQSNLFRIKKEMKKIGIRFSINPWITVGHNDRGRDDRKNLPGLRTIVGHDNTRCTCCACPLSKVWRDNVAAVWSLYAETDPHVIWIEDDIRTFNHSPVSYGCFCSEHMRRFSKRIGSKVTRRELVAALLKPGKPHPWRAEFLDMQAEIMIETVGFLARVVHRTAPQTSLGLMSSGPRTHCLEGRRWLDFAASMADGRPLYSRPPMGNYSEASLRGFYYSHDSIKITRHCLPPETIEQTEVENVPFTRYANSATFTFVEMAISFAYGSDGVTMNLFDHAGTPMEQEQEFGRMLAAKKPFLEGLARRARQPGVYRGVQLLYHERESYHKRLGKGADYGALGADGSATMTMLESHGLPTTYEQSDVVASSGQQLRAFSDDEIRALFSRGLLLDATAARVLHERGFGPQIGLKSIKPPRHLDALGAFAAEEFFNKKFGGAEKSFLTLTLPDLGGRPHLSLVETLPGIEEISRIVDPDAPPHHLSMYAFENDLGGRVVVHLFDLTSAYGVAFNHPFRAAQLQGAVRWLGRGKVPLLARGGVYPLAFRKDCEDQTLLGLFNLTLDPWPHVEFELADRRKVKKLELLSPGGRWQQSRHLSASSRGGKVTVRYDRSVPCDAPLMVTINWE